MRKIFTQTGDWKAKSTAEKWCEERDISVGTMQRGEPRGLRRGNFSIAKWGNLDATDIVKLDGAMTGNMRDGPVTIELTGRAEGDPK